MNEDEVVQMRGGWRFEKTFNIGHVATVLTLVLGVALPGLIWGTSVETRLSMLQRDQISLMDRQDKSLENLKERLDREAEWRAQEMRDIKSALTRIETKVDQKADRSSFPLYQQ